MNINPTPFGLPDAAPELARRFAMIMAGLGALVARRFLKMPHLVGFTGLLWGRLNRAVRRFYRALTVPAQARAPRVRADHAATTRGRPEGLPRGRGWIVRELGWEAAAYLVQLENLLGEIATQHALAAAPGAGRVLRPICRMLGVPAALTPKLAPAALTPKLAPAALTPKLAPAALTPKLAFAALTPKLTSAAFTPTIVASAPGGAAPGQGLIFSAG